MAFNTILILFFFLDKFATRFGCEILRLVLEITIKLYPFLMNVVTRRLTEKPMWIDALYRFDCSEGFLQTNHHFVMLDQYLMALFFGKARQKEIDGRSLATVQRQLTSDRLC